MAHSGLGHREHDRAASAVFPSLRAARSARNRLARAGFARNSIEIERDGDAFAVSIATREENRDRAERILTGSPLGHEVREAGERALDSVRSSRPLALGLAALAGFALYRLTNRR
ncbi:hypothetical protein [Methylobacterium nigriterrae]|uniref:hypothetical protein n=1 Tax=Methylobacterium nigriterrae TaxID=3127512 RepID=UPI003013EF95